MDLSSLRSVLLADPALAQAVSAAQGTTPSQLDLGAPRPLRPFVIAALASVPPVGAGRPVLAVTATDREATDLAAALGALLDPDSVAEYPAWETLPHERLSPRADTVGRRLAVRRRLRHPSDGQLAVVVTPVRALVQPQVAGLGDLEPVALQVGDEVGLDDVVARLIAAGYTRVDLVERRGEIAVRGGILDVFPPTEDHPLRVEFFGDEVEEIRVFKAADQRSLGDDFPATRGLWAPPCRELLLTPQVLERAAALAAKHPQLADILGKVAHGIAVEGMESLASVLVDKMDLLLDEMPPDTVVLLCDPERVRARAAEVVRTGEEFLQAAWAGAASGGKAPIDLSSAALRPLGDVRAHALSLGLAWWSVSPLAATAEIDASETEADADVLVIDAVAAEAYRGDTQAVVADVKGWLADGWRVLFTTAGHGPAQRIAEVLRGEGVAGPARVRTARRSRTRRSRCVVRSARRRVSKRAHRSSCCSPRTTCSVSAPRRVIWRSCRVGASGRSIRCSCNLATSSCTSSTAWAASSKWCSARSPARRASTWSSSTQPANAGSPATDCMRRPTHSIRSRATSAARIRRSIEWAAPTGRNARVGRARPSRKSRLS